ncbi:MAG: signal peptidase II [Desulfobacteraceae bacterium]|nr:signal peptidase II [Desulfobacteraceae bacterium]MCF8094755.1 signal peptidase II [Desulfobacteraceae bacterium]
MDFVKRHGLFICAAVGTIAADQATKWVIVNWVPLYETIKVIPGFLDIVHYRNPGGAFGIFASNGGFFMALAFLAITIGALCLILYLYSRTPREKPLFAAALALVFGGAAGNLIDRLRFGNVVDFIDVYVSDYHWPAFNLADSAITIGMIIFAGYVIFKKAPL